MTVDASDWNNFALVFNDVKQYPSMTDVALKLGVSYQTVRNKSVILRGKALTDDSLPKIINRGSVRAVTKDEDGTPEEHANARAVLLSNEITSLITGTKYPVINPEAIVVQSHMTHSYDRSTRGRRQRESTPRTWLSDTLKVAPVKRFKNRKFIFTGAQNDTELHPIWNNLLAYADYINAEVVVGPGTYETSWWSENNPSSRAYAEGISDHLCFGSMEIGDNFVFCGEMNILPTASTPISDLQTYSRGKWGVFPHAKRQLKSVPSTNPDVQAHQVMTTGLCTMPKVIPRKAGIKSIFHYVAGATIVEFDRDGDIFCRQITAGKDGAFYDLEHHVDKGVVKVCEFQTIRVITGLDIHRAKMSPRSAETIFGIDIVKKRRSAKRNIIDDLRPMEWLAHDLFDNQTRNHHNEDDNAMDYELAYRGKDCVLDEVIEAAEFLHLMERPWMKIRVIESNHDIALERYVREGRYRNDGKNIRYGLQLEDAYLEYRERVGDALNAYKPPPSFSVLEYAIRKLKLGGIDAVTWVYDGKSYIIDGIECGHHFFRGANGSRGTISGFSRLGVKMSGGDKHSPEINEGVFCGGVADLQHGYNKGPSGWMVTLIVQYIDGKRTLITQQNGKHRA